MRVSASQSTLVAGRALERSKAGEEVEQSPVGEEWSMEQPAVVVGPPSRPGRPAAQRQSKRLKGNFAGSGSNSGKVPPLYEGPGRAWGSENRGAGRGARQGNRPDERRVWGLGQSGRIVAVARLTAGLRYVRLIAGADRDGLRERRGRVVTASSPTKRRRQRGRPQAPSAAPPQRLPRNRRHVAGGGPLHHLHGRPDYPELEAQGLPIFLLAPYTAQLLKLACAWRGKTARAELG
ncbi:hypothetical protein THAOC_34660, partial [Thalassiosira oceanica]